MTVWRIKNIETNKYLSSGSVLKYTKEGKLWTTKGNAINHLLQFNRIDSRTKTNLFLDNINKWVVEEYELQADKQIDLLDFVSKGDYKMQYEILSCSNK